LSFSVGIGAASAGVQETAMRVAMKMVEGDMIIWIESSRRSCER
jgi:hypothetical protein